MRDELDRYYTPYEVALACLSCTPIAAGDRILEPSVGKGSFVRALDALYPSTEHICCDLDPEAPYTGKFECVDFLEYNPTLDVDWVIGNPPYSAGLQHVQHALSIAKVGVAFLLRYSFLESLSRMEFWRNEGACLYHIAILAPRPSFTSNGRADSSGYGWFVWVKGYSGSARIHPSWDWKKQYGLLPVSVEP